MPTHPLPEAYGDETPVKTELTAETPGIRSTWEELQLLLSKFSPICICLQGTMLGAYDHPPPRGYLAFYSHNPEQMHHGGTAVLIPDKCVVKANDGSSVTSPHEVAEVYATAFADVS
ncbi:hypothetical protein Hamer_G018499 [Homarus americanus]|uniref:Uncharacterized protein n=1 Tax=Homarus americanus TaxID=6706 RepID=A0A8J5JAD8_HOMAM|nr:hypothetical protein Hamer_G018499 [Homarus americanus]